MKNSKSNTAIAIDWAKEQVEKGKLVYSSEFFMPFSKAKISALKQSLKEEGIIAWPMPKGKKLNAGAFLIKIGDSRLISSSDGFVVVGSWIDDVKGSILIMPVMPASEIA